jgi:hypothetical protein
MPSPNSSGAKFMPSATCIVERTDQNEEIFARFMNDKSFQKVVTGWLSSAAYRKLTGQ